PTVCAGGSEAGGVGVGACMNPRTWDDVRDLALRDPFLQKMVTWIRQGMPREVALITTVCELSVERQRLLDEAVRLSELLPPEYLVKTPQLTDTLPACPSCGCTNAQDYRP